MADGANIAQDETSAYGKQSLLPGNKVGDFKIRQASKGQRFCFRRIFGIAGTGGF
jgi:hypothetical protein